MRQITPLGASWALNAVLVPVLIFLFLTKRAPDGSVTNGIPGRAKPAAALTAQPDVSVASFPTAAPAAEQRQWLVAELRAMGVPNRVLARIVLADLDAAWTKYSAAEALRCHGDATTMAALQLEYDRTRDADMRAALGEEGFRQWDQGNMLREVDRGNVPLSATETAAGYGIWKNLQQRHLELRQARLKGDMDESEVSAALERAVSEYSAQMKSLLGTERYAAAQSPGTSGADAGLRDQLATANPSAAQFADLLRSQQHWNQQRADLDQQFQSDPSSSAYASEIKALDEARDAAYRRVLGDDAFAALQKAQNPSYASMKKHQEVWGLDDQTIDSVYGSLAYYEKSVADYQSQAHALETQGQPVDWNAVNSDLRRFAEQSQQALRNYLGADRFDRLSRNGVFTPLAESPHYERPNGDLNRTNTVSVR